MKAVLVGIFIFTLKLSAFAQDMPAEVTPEMLEKMKMEIEESIFTLKSKMFDEDFSTREIEFALDTFRVEELSRKYTEIDYSTLGMKDALQLDIDGYDKLLNKYYNLLMKSLGAEDKQTLKTAQKAWLVYRDAEKELVWTMTKDEYSGGGTIQGIIGMDNYLQLVKSRTLALYQYYASIIVFDE